MRDKVAILLATYNGEKYLEEQLQSILNQSYENWVLFIHDDGSYDGTKEIIYKYSTKYKDKIIFLDDNTSFRSSNLNFEYLMKYLLTTDHKSDYIMFSDQDDIWFPDKIKTTLLKMKKMEDNYGKNTPLLVHSDLVVVNHELNLISKSFWKYYSINPKESGFNSLLFQNVVTGCSMMINRPALKLSLPFPKEILVHDWWIALVVSKFGKINFIEKPLLY